MRIVRASVTMRSLVEEHEGGAKVKVKTEEVDRSSHYKAPVGEVLTETIIGIWVPQKQLDEVGLLLHMMS